MDAELGYTGYLNNLCQGKIGGSVLIDMQISKHCSTAWVGKPIYYDRVKQVLIEL